MTPLSTLIRFEFAKLFRRPMTWILGVVLPLFFIFIYGSLAAAVVAVEAEEGGVEGVDTESLRELLLLPDGLYFGAGFTQQLEMILLIILAAGSFGSEFSWGTYRTVLLTGVSRTRIVVSKLIALLVMALVAVLAGMFLALAGSIASGILIGDAPPASEWLDAAFLGDVAIAAVIAYVGVVVWMLIAAAVTLVMHSLAAGLGITLAVALLGGQIALLISQLGRVGEYVSRLFPNHGVDSLILLLSNDPPDYVATDWIWIIANVIIWPLALVIIATIIFRRMNILATAS